MCVGPAAEVLTTLYFLPWSLILELGAGPRQIGSSATQHPGEATTAFTFKTLLRLYAKRVLTLR